MIIRLLHAQVPDGRELALLERLRGIVETGRHPGGLVATSFGFRRDDGALHFLALSTWESIDAIAEVGGADPASPIVRDDRIVPEISIDLFEAAADSTWPDSMSGTTLGLIRGRVARHAEVTAHEMVRAVAPEVARAGVTALSVGRRIDEGEVELLIVATWRDRLSLHRFGKGRTSGTLDPAFVSLLTDWRFETYDVLDPQSLLLPTAGPAILLADDEGRFVDASPGIEALLGLPAELILRQTIEDLTPPDMRTDFGGQWRAFLDAGHASGRWTLQRADGTSVSLEFRAQANCPTSGIHASVLTHPDSGAVSQRAISEMVAEAFPVEELVQV
jgi:PAS domain S-box-containing protein